MVTGDDSMIWEGAQEWNSDLEGWLSSLRAGLTYSSSTRSIIFASAYAAPRFEIFSVIIPVPILGHTLQSALCFACAHKITLSMSEVESTSQDDMLRERELV